MAEVLQADRDLWDLYGPEIFHCAIQGAEVLAMVREHATLRADAVIKAAKKIDEFVYMTPDCQRPDVWFLRVRELRDALSDLPEPPTTKGEGE